VKLSLRRAAIANGLLWGGGILFAGLFNLFDARYAEAFLQVMGSLYPRFHASRTFGDVLIGTFYGLVDGGFAGFFFAWLYNAFGGS
jgi:hypothetical protein